MRNNRSSKPTNRDLKIVGRMQGQMGSMSKFSVVVSVVTSADWELCIMSKSRQSLR